MYKYAIVYNLPTGHSLEKSYPLDIMSFQFIVNYSGYVAWHLSSAITLHAQGYGQAYLVRGHQIRPFFIPFNNSFLFVHSKPVALTHIHAVNGNAYCVKELFF